MIDYGKPPSNQMQLDGIADGCEEMKEARRWVGLNFRKWCQYKEIARGMCSDGSKASPDLTFKLFKRQCGVSMPNHFAPYLARIALEEDPSIRFNLRKSKADGWTEATL